MAKTHRNEEHALDAPNPRPTFSNAYDYYTDYYSEKEENTFRIIKDSWENIHRSNDPSKKITSTDLKLISLISTLIKQDPLGIAYFSSDYLCAKLDITDRQLRTVRKNINHIFSSRWRKATRINGALKKNVYVFAYTLQGKEILGASAKYYESVKLGSGLPTSIYKYDKYIKDRSSESTFCKNSNSSQAKIYSPKFKQYDKPKTLGDHYPLTTEDCSKLQRRSSREFTLNAMNEILLDMSRRLHRMFQSKVQFMAYMATVYSYEKRDAVKTANLDFHIKTNKTKAEIIEITTYEKQKDFLGSFEDLAITHVCPENQLKAKWACTLSTNQAYQLLLNLRFVQLDNKILKVYLTKDVELLERAKNEALGQVQAVGAFMEVEKLEFIVKQKG